MECATIFPGTIRGIIISGSMITSEPSSQQAACRNLLREADLLKVRNPKSEGRKKSEIRTKTANRGIVRISTFGFLSAFGFRISGFAYRVSLAGDFRTLL